VFCRTCRGPAGAGFARCYQCELALSDAGRLLADAVAPVGYAVRGGPLAEDLRRYKSDRAAAAEVAAAAARLRELLAGFLAGSTGALRNPYPTDLTPPKKPAKEPDEPA